MAAPIPLSPLTAASSPRDPLVILLMKGHPGSGKSTLAQNLARSLRWPLVDKDVFRDATMLLERNDGPCATPVNARVLNSLSYDAMWQMAEVQLDLGLSVVVDCPLAHEVLFKAGVALGKRAGAEVAVIECHVSDLDTWKRRIESRAAAALSDGQTSDNVQICADSSRTSVPRDSGGILGARQDQAGHDDSQNRAAPDVEAINDGDSAEGLEGDGRTGTEGDGRTVESVTDRDQFTRDSQQSDVDRECSEDVREDQRGEEGEQKQTAVLKGRWHRPACWEDMQELLDRYDGCWSYPTGSVPKLTIDTSTVGPDEALSLALGWLKTALIVQ